MLLLFFVFSDLHEVLVQSCLDGDLNQVLQLAYYQTDQVQSLIHGEMPCITSKEFPGDVQPGEYIHAATAMGNVEIVAQLINLGVDPNMQSRFGTPFEIACKNGKLDIVRLLHTHGLDLHSGEKEIWESGIYVACEKGHFDVVQFIVSVQPELLTHESEGFADGCILFCVACANGNMRSVRLLAEKGIDINGLTCLKDGTLKTPLTAACDNGCDEVIEYLILQHVEIPRLIVEQHAKALAPAFQRYVYVTINHDN